jgi:photosystem II stability/assembly factor-like uncharacterized protein
MDFFGEARARTAETPARTSCQNGYAVTNPAAAAPHLLVTKNGGTWTKSAADPLTSSDDAATVAAIDMGRDAVRVIVTLGSTRAGSPMAIAYTDDDGANWTEVVVGATNGQYSPGKNAFFVLDRTSMWLATSGGYIYWSGDAGASWTAIEAGAITAGAIHAVHFADAMVGYMGGATNVIARTLDGGASWEQLTGPAARSADTVTSIRTLDRNRAWIGYNSGHLYYTLDGGATWTLRSFAGSGAGSIADIDFFSELIGYVVHNPAAGSGRLLKSIDGGFTWEPVTVPANAALRDIHVCDQWDFFLAGDATGGTGFIAKGES